MIYTIFLIVQDEVEHDAKCANIYNFKGYIMELSHLIPLFFKKIVEDDDDR